MTDPFFYGQATKLCPAILDELLRCEVGSTAHGVGLPGNDDFDMIGIVAERPQHWVGVKHFDNFIFRTAAEREGKHDARSMPGDIDLTLYSIRKFASLAGKGNPSVLLVLYAPVIYQNGYGALLRKNAPLFISRQAGRRFLGYMTAQKERLMGVRGQKRCRRQDLIDSYGYDTKYAMHVLRLGRQGEELMMTGKLQLPMRLEDRQFLIGVRQGKLSMEEVVEGAAYYEERLKHLVDHAALPEEPDWAEINDFVVNLYRDIWEEHSVF